MITLIVFVLGVASAALAHRTGRLRSRAMYATLMADCYERLIVRIDAGEDPAGAILEVFNPDRIESWTTADMHRVLDRHRAQ